MNRYYFNITTDNDLERYYQEMAVYITGFIFEIYLRNKEFKYLKKMRNYFISEVYQPVNEVSDWIEKNITKIDMCDEHILTITFRNIPSKDIYNVMKSRAEYFCNNYGKIKYNNKSSWTKKTLKYIDCELVSERIIFEKVY